MDENYLFQLKTPLEYSVDGKFEQTSTIVFSPPTMSVLKESTEFEQLLMGAMMGLAEFSKDLDIDKEGGPDSAPSLSEIRTIIFASQKIKVIDIASAFKKLAEKTAKLDSKTFIKADLMNRMDMNEFIDMLCGYASNFSFPSLFNGE